MRQTKTTMRPVIKHSLICLINPALIESGTPTPLTAAHHKAEEEADFGHVSDGQLAHGAQHGLVVLGSGVGHPRQLGLQGLSGGQLTHLHDVTETHPLLFGCWE